MKKRILALVLTVLMVVGAVPMAVFAADSEASTIPYEKVFATPNGDEIAAEIGAENLYLYNDFDSATAASDSAINASASHRVATYGFCTKGSTWGLIDDGNGGKAINYYNGFNTNLSYYLTSGYRTFADADNMNKNFVFSADIKAGEKMTDGQMFTLNSYAVTNNSSYLYTAIPLYVKADGTLYVPDASSGIVTKVNGWRGNSYAQAIGKLSTDNFTNVAIQVNSAENWFMVYVDGVAKTGKLLLAGETILASYKTDGEGIYANGRFCPTSFSFGYRVTADPISHYYIWDNMAFYYADDVVTKFVPVLHDGEVTSSLVGDAPVWTAPDANAITSALGDSALIYYNNFNDGTVNGSGIGNASFTRNNAWKMVDNGNGDYAFQTSGGQQNTMITIGKNHGAQVTTYSGKSFTFSSDFKLGTETQTGGLFYFMSTVKNAASSGIGFTAMPVWMDASGNLYNGQITSTITGDSSKKAIDSGTMWQSNDVGAQSELFCTAANKIGALSADKYTNVAVTVDLENNKYNIYIDGVCVAANQTFACQTMLDYYAEVDASYNGVEFTDGYGISGVCLGYRNSVAGDSYIFDNWLLYEGADLVGWSEDTREVVQDFSGATTGYYPVSGLGYEADYVYYFENGEAIANTTSADGILTTDENGRVMLGEDYITSLGEVYIVVGENDIVPVNGIFKDGVYEANSILGVNGAPYNYDADGNRSGYDGEYEGKLYEDSALVNGEVGGIFYVDGVVANGVVGDKYYVDGVGASGEFGGKLYEDGVLVNGVVGDKMYVDGVPANGTVGDKYYVDGTPASGEFGGKLYEDGVLVSGVVGDKLYVDGVPANGEIDGDLYVDGVVVNNVIVDKETGNVYDNIQDMVDNVAEGSTVKVYGDIVSDTEITIGNQVKLELNGNTITAPGLTIFAGTEIVDDAANRGVINVPKGTLIVSRETTDMTVYYEEGVGYKFANVKKQNADPEANENGDGFTFVFRPSLDNSTDLNKALFADGGDDNDMKFVVKLVNENGETIRSFVYAEKVVKDAYANDLAFKLTVRKLDPVTHGTVTVYYGIETAAGMACYIEAGSFTPTAAEPVV